MDGFADPQKSVIVPIFTPIIAIPTGTDNLFSYENVKKGKTGEPILPLIL
jgi:hypothetical protein